LSDVLRRVKGFFVPGEKNAFLRIQELAGLAEEALQLLVKILATPSHGLKDIRATQNGSTYWRRTGTRLPGLLKR